MSVKSYFISLLLTLLIESFLARIILKGEKCDIKKVLLINFITHPVINIILWIIVMKGFFRVILIPLLFLETFVVLFEWKLLNIFYYQRKSANNLKLSILMNTASFLPIFLM